MATEKQDVNVHYAVTMRSEGSAEESSSNLAVVTFGHNIEGDEALKLVGGHASAIPIDSATHKRLLKKIDLILMPVFFIVYGIQFLDKTTLSYASVTGIIKDLHLKGDNYNWLGSAFYFGYLGSEYVAIYLLQRLPLAKYSGACIIAWGLVVACLAGTHDFAGALMVRLILGMCEASVSPAWTLFTSQWYRKDEQDLRTSIWFSANGFGQIFGGLVAYGIAHGADTHGFSIAAWKIIFLFSGLLTVVLGIVFLVVVPDSQLNAWWLSPEDRRLAVERVRVNEQGIGNKVWKAYQLREALSDPITWLLFISSLAAAIPNGGLSNFFSLLIQSFGYTAQQSLLYGCIIGALEIVAIFGWVYISRGLKSRLLGGVVTLGVGLVGIIVVIALPRSNGKGRLAGYFVAQLFIGNTVALFSLLATNVGGYTKKTTVAGIFFIGYCAGNIIGPQTFRPEEQPHYRSALITIVVCWGVGLLNLLVIYVWYVRRNKSKASIRSGEHYVKLPNQEFLDLTDRENPEFIYVL